jgi:hypothetical protein
MESPSVSSLAKRLSSRLDRRRTVTGLGGCGLSLGLLGSVGLRPTTALASTQTEAPTWHLAGDAMEACRCAVTCPCNFTSDPTEIPCNSIVGWHIAKGEYGDIALDDLNVVAYLQLPNNIFAGDWKLGFYFDDRASTAQFEALGTIFGGQAGGWPAALAPLIGTPFPPKKVPIHYALADGEVQVSIPGLLEIGTEHVPNPMPGMPPLDLKVSNLVVPFYTGTADVRRSTILKLSDPDLSFEYLGRSALIGTFTYEGP